MMLIEETFFEIGPVSIENAAVGSSETVLRVFAPRAVLLAAADSPSHRTHTFPQQEDRWVV